MEDDAGGAGDGGGEVGMVFTEDGLHPVGCEVPRFIDLVRSDDKRMTGEDVRFVFVQHRAGTKAVKRSSWSCSVGVMVCRY